MAHIADTGLQAHSAGPLYPWSVRGVGDSWQAINLLTGEIGHRFQYESGNAKHSLLANKLAHEDAHDRKVAK